MKLTQAVVLLAAVFAGSTTLSEASDYGGCDSYICGTNAECSMSEGRPVCSCLNRHMGDPLVACYKVECHINEDCPRTRVCSPNKNCVDPCIGVCDRINGRCEVRNHIVYCLCAPGFTGDAFLRCFKIPPKYDEEDEDEDNAIAAADEEFPKLTPNKNDSSLADRA